MYSESDLLPISALQHLVFCERQCALIHLEGQWAENRLTMEGRHLHERVDDPGVQTRDGARIARGVPLVCHRLGLAGRADIVEFHPLPPVGPVFEPVERTSVEPPSQPTESAVEPAFRSAESAVEPAFQPVSLQPGAKLPNYTGLWRPVPVEYKRGRPKKDDSDKVQLCAQALALEEMLGVVVPIGVFFYGQTRRRVEVAIDVALRRRTEWLAARMHEIIRSGRTPPAIYEKKCDNCSLIELCLPKVTDGRHSVQRYLNRGLAAMSESAGEST